MGLSEEANARLQMRGEYQWQDHGSQCNQWQPKQLSFGLSHTLVAHFPHLHITDDACMLVLEEVFMAQSIVFHIPLQPGHCWDPASRFGQMHI